jgi:transcriptional regulator with XRE-family HTH domain
VKVQRPIQSGNVALVDLRERGQVIQRRRLAHGFRSLREFAERTGLSRESVTKAERGEASVGTYQRLEAWLDAFDHEVGEENPPTVEQITFTVAGDFGVTVTVKGPIADRLELEASVANIIRSIREGGPK